MAHGNKNNNYVIKEPIPMLVIRILVGGACYRVVANTRKEAIVLAKKANDFDPFMGGCSIFVRENEFFDRQKCIKSIVYHDRNWKKSSKSYIREYTEGERAPYIVERYRFDVRYLETNLFNLREEAQEYFEFGDGAFEFEEPGVPIISHCYYTVQLSYLYDDNAYFECKTDSFLEK